MFKKYFLISLLALNFVFVPMHFVFAQDLSQDIANKAGYGDTNSSSLSETIGKIIKIVLGLLGTIFLVLTVYAGALWLTAAGEEAKVEKAMDILKTAVIGLVIILAAYSITYFVLDKVFEATLL